MNWISQHKGLFILTIVIVAGAVWYGLSQGGSAQPLLTTSTPASAAAGGDQQLVSTLLALRAVTLTGTIFQDPAFTSLHDNGTTIVPEPVGRPNPFAPFTSGAQGSATTSHQAQIFAPSR